MKKDPDFTALLLESEASVDEKIICETFNIDENRFVFLRYDHNVGAEGMIDILESYIRAVDFDMIVVNSLKLMTPTKIMEESASNQMPAVQAKLWGRMTQKFTSIVAERNTAFVAITHVYDAIGSYRPTKVVAGGSAVQYWASIIMIFSKRSILETDPVSRDDSMHIEVSLVKNRLNPGYNRFDYFVTLGKGTEQILPCLPLLIDAGIVIRKGAYLYFTYEGEEIRCNSKKNFREWMIEHPDQWEFLKAQLPTTTTVTSITKEEAEALGEEYGIDINDDVEITKKGQ